MTTHPTRKDATLGRMYLVQVVQCTSELVLLNPSKS
jgi:hypothetical protein